MRLTLRTLLAYLDDTLEPAQAKAIGHKIAESPTAKEIIDRIKEVVRRRRLTTPPATGPNAKLDPNTVSEYIDSVLPADQLAQVEEICLESDVYLAEIAACHQILTVVLSEPALVPPTARQRMYGLVQGPEAIPYRKVARLEQPNGITAGAGMARDETDDTLLLGLPFFNRHGTWVRWLLPIAGVVLLVAAIGVAVWIALPPQAHISPPSSDWQFTQANNSAREASPGTSLKTPDKAESKTPEKPDRGTPDTPETKSADKAENKVPDKSENKPPDRPETKTPDKPEIKKPEKPESQPPENIAAKTPDRPEAKTPDKPEQKPSKGDRKVVGKYVSPATADPNILLQRQSNGTTWHRLTHQDSVYSEDSLVSLPGYRSKIQMDRGIELVLWGNLMGQGSSGKIYAFESAVVLHDAPSVDLDITVNHGRIAVTNSKPEGNASIRIRFHDESWELTMEPASEVAFELTGEYMPGVDFSRQPGKDDGPSSYAGLFVLKGEIAMKVRYATHRMREPKGPALYLWDNVRGPAPAPESLPSLPAWAAKASPRSPNLKMAQALENLSRRLTPKTKVEDILPELVNENDPASQRLAVYTMAAVNDLPDLLEALADESHSEVRLAAIEALRHWTGQSADRDLKLFQSLAKKYKPMPAEIIMHLLHGFSEQRLNEPDTYETLIEYLKNDYLPVRQLAFWHLANLRRTSDIAKTIPYRPEEGTDQRERAYSAWKEKIPTGRLPPLPAPKK
jgi:hypothetical protein